MKMQRLAAQIVKLKAQMKALGMFTNDRELLECPNCDLTEDVSADGLLFTFHRSGTDWAIDSGLPPSILNEKVGTVSPQLPLNLEKLLNNLLERGYGFCFEARQKRLLIGGEHFFKELVNLKSQIVTSSWGGLRRAAQAGQTGQARTLDEAIARNRKELGYGG